MRNVLADLAVESEAATTLAIRLAAAYDATDRDDADPHEVAFARLATAVGKYWVCKRRPGSPPRRSSAWAATATSRSRSCPACSASRRSTASGRGRATSSASTCCGRWAASPSRVDAFREEVLAGEGRRPPLRRALPPARRELADTDDLEARARRIVEAMALALQGSLLVRAGLRRRSPTRSAASRLDPRHVGRGLRHAAVGRRPRRDHRATGGRLRR